MTSADLVSIAAWLGGALLAVTLIGLIWWAIFGDRAGTRRRCPRCWHDLSATQSLICGECGHDGQREERLHRPRRRWRLAGFALIVLLAAASVVRWQAADVGWASMTPTKVLLWMLPWTDGIGGDVSREIAMRLRMAEMSDSSRAALLARCLAGDREATRGSALWRDRYAHHLAWWQQVGSAPNEERARLLELQPSVEVLAPRRYVGGAPVCMQLLLRDWWPVEAEIRVTARPRAEGGSELVVVALAGEDRPRLPVLAPPPSADATEVVFDVMIERRFGPLTTPAERKATQDEAWVLAASLELRIPLGERMQAERDFEAVDSPEMTDALQAVFADGLRRWESGERRHGLFFRAGATRSIDFDDVALGVVAEVCEEGVPRRTSRIWWRGGTRGGNLGWEISREEISALQRLAVGDDRWTLRVRGAPDIALRAAARELAGRAGSTERGALDETVDSGKPLRWWSGEFTLPLRLNEEPGAAPERPWRVVKAQE